MAEDSKQAQAAEDVLPIKKTSPTTMIAGGVALVLIAGFVIYSMSGGEPAPASKASRAAAKADAGLSKAELEERQAHLKKTQAALVAAAVDDAEEQNLAAKKAQAAHEAEPAQDSQPASTPAKSTPAKSTPAKSTPAKSTPAPKKAANSKKSIEGLDSLGADIASALK